MGSKNIPEITKPPSVYSTNIPEMATRLRVHTTMQTMQHSAERAPYSPLDLSPCLSQALSHEPRPVSTSDHCSC